MFAIGHSTLHLSWVGIILQRVFAHDVRSIVKLGVCSCLEMKLDQSPLLLRENWEVVEIILAFSFNNYCGYCLSYPLDNI